MMVFFSFLVLVDVVFSLICYRFLRYIQQIIISYRIFMFNIDVERINFFISFCCINTYLGIYICYGFFYCFARLPAIFRRILVFIVFFIYLGYRSIVVIILLHILASFFFIFVYLLLYICTIFIIIFNFFIFIHDIYEYNP
jgi:hypothetical protein